MRPSLGGRSAMHCGQSAGALRQSAGLFDMALKNLGFLGFLKT